MDKDFEEFDWAKELVNDSLTDTIDLKPYMNDVVVRVGLPWDNLDIYSIGPVEVNTGDVFFITGKEDGLSFDDEAMLINYDDAFLFRFEKAKTNPGSGESTHCGPDDEEINTLCGCDGPIGKGACWWVKPKSLEKIYLLKGVKNDKFLKTLSEQRIFENEAEEFNDEDFGWLEGMSEPNLSPEMIEGNYFIVAHEGGRSKNHEIIIRLGGLSENKRNPRYVQDIETSGTMINYTARELTKVSRSLDSTGRWGDRNDVTRTKIGNKIYYIQNEWDRETSIELEWANHLIETNYWVPITKEELTQRFGPSILYEGLENKTNLITEGQYDAITGIVVRDIMKVIKGEYEEYEEYDEDDDMALPSSDPEDMYAQEGMAFKVSLNINRVEEFDGDYIIQSATAKGKKNVILVDIYINPEYEPQIYGKIFFKLQEDIRHEIEHFTQEGEYRIKDRPKPPKRGTASIKTVYAHHIEATEIPALVAGFYRVAKLRRVPLDQVMEEDLNSEMERGEITAQEKDDLMRIFIDYAKKRYPRAIYRSEV